MKIKPPPANFPRNHGLAALPDALPPLLHETEIAYTSDASADGMAATIQCHDTDFVTEASEPVSEDVADRGDIQTKRLDWG